MRNLNLIEEKLISAGNYAAPSTMTYSTMLYLDSLYANCRIEPYLIEVQSVGYDFYGPYVIIDTYQDYRLICD